MGQYMMGFIRTELSESMVGEVHGSVHGVASVSLYQRVICCKI